MLRRALVVLLAAGLSGLVYVQLTPGPAFACEGATSVSLDSGTHECEIPGDDAVSLSQDGGGHTYRLRPKCDAFSDDINRCKHLTRCGPANYLFDLLQDGKDIGDVCLDPDQASQFGEITPSLVLREFKNLDWSSAELVIQPSDNRTLVNFKTHFYTDLAEPATQTITLLGRKVVIEASPSSYIWHSDQGAETWTTTDPSRPIETGDDPADLNHYIYESKGTALPSVDVVYSGRYQVDGGAWQEIPDTLTISGEPVGLRVLEATPVLTGEN